MSANSPTLFETLGCLPSTLSPPSGLINEWVTDLASAETEGDHHLRQWNPVVDSYINMFPPWFRFYYRTRPLATSRDDATWSLPNVDDNVSISAKQEKTQMQTFGYWDSRWANGFNNLPLTGGVHSSIHPSSQTSLGVKQWLPSEQRLIVVHNVLEFHRMYIHMAYHDLKGIFDCTNTSSFWELITLYKHILFL